jgi:hypothetical protein
VFLSAFSVSAIQQTNPRTYKSLGPIPDSEAKWIEVAVFKAALSLDEHRQCNGLVRLTAATAFISIALAWSGVPDWPGCCAKAVGESVRTAADAAAIRTAPEIELT